jgi:hypothetical protein
MPPQAKISAGWRGTWRPGCCCPPTTTGFDGQRAQFKYFSGAGKFLDTRLSDDPEIAKRCAAAFEAVWERAIPHQDYQLR